MNRRNEGKREIVCQHCQWKWNTASKHTYVTCPSCLRKTLNKPVRRIPLTPEAEIAKKALKSER